MTAFRLFIASIFISRDLTSDSRVWHLSAAFRFIFSWSLSLFSTPLLCYSASASLYLSWLTYWLCSSDVLSNLRFSSLSFFISSSLLFEDYSTSNISLSLSLIDFLSCSNSLFYWPYYRVKESFCYASSVFAF